MPNGRRLSNREFSAKSVQQVGVFLHHFDPGYPCVLPFPLAPDERIVPADHGLTRLWGSADLELNRLVIGHPLA